MTRTEQQISFAQQMQNIEISDTNYSFLEGVYLQGYSIDLITEIAGNLEVLGVTEPDEFVESFNSFLLDIQPL